MFDDTRTKYEHNVLREAVISPEMRVCFDSSSSLSETFMSLIKFYADYISLLVPSNSH